MFKKKSDPGVIYSCMSGEIIPLSDVPDPVFSEGMLGKGYAIIPNQASTELLMPADGEIKSISDTNHAVNILTSDGLEILIHIGIDTVELGGKGFEVIRKPGDRLNAGNPIMKVDFEAIRAAGKETVTPVVITNPEVISVISPVFGKTDAGRNVTMKYRKHA